MKEENRLGILVWRGCENGVIAVWMEATDDFCAGRFADAQAHCAEGDAAIGIDAGVGALAPDVRPPRAGGSGAQGRAFLAQGEFPSGLRGGADFAMFFLGVAVDAQGVEQGIGRGEGGDALGGEDRGQALLPEVVEAFDFAFGLRRGGVAQRDFVEAQRGAELGEGVGLMGEEEGMIIDIEGQWQATGGEGAGEEIQMRQQRLARVEPRQGHDATVIVDDLDEVKWRTVLAKPAVG